MSDCDGSEPTIVNARVRPGRSFGIFNGLLGGSRLLSIRAIADKTDVLQ